MTTAPITIDGQGATISGANVLGSWTALGDGTFRASWPHNLGNLADPWPTLSYDRVLLNREAMFVGQTPTTSWTAPPSSVPGTFLVDEGANTITARPRAGAGRITSAEVTVRGKTLQVNGRTNVTVRNLTLERGAGAIQENMAGASNSTNFTVDNVTVRQAAAGGFSIGNGKGATLRNVRFLDNGISGLRLVQADRDPDRERGAGPQQLAGRPGGLHRVGSGRQVRDDQQHHDQGLERPSQLQPRTVVRHRQQRTSRSTGLVSAGNLGRGVSLEKNPGPIVIDGAKVCNNGMSGISYARSDRTTVRNSQVFNNAGWQHLHTGSSTPVRMPDGTTRLRQLADAAEQRHRWRRLGAEGLDETRAGCSGRPGTKRRSGARRSSAGTRGITRSAPTRSGPARSGMTGTTTTAFASKARETGGRWANPGTLSCPAPRPAQTADFAVGW